MLTPFQEELARLVAGMEEAEGFALAGGAALILRGAVDRTTADRDFFARDATAVDRLVPAFELAAEKSDMHVDRIQVAPGFARLEITRGDDRCELDLGFDARLWQPDRVGAVGQVLAEEELAADKTLALFGRAAARDFVDVYALAKRFGEDRLCELAAAKDLGFSERYLGQALGAIHRLDRAQFQVSDKEYDNIVRWADSWRLRLERELAPGVEPSPAPDRPLEPGQDTRPEIGF